ncbi:hypothetical protein C7271_06800 [filamentous cyanobacterium CCP5]|nr:hypothetical protein C7271_06800 [filamentous cyanobacterium CCP5]
MENVFSRYQPSPPEAADILVVHQLAQDFRLEMDHRERLEQYHLWYCQVCQQHQQELEAMAAETNLLAWFRQLWRQPPE